MKVTEVGILRNPVFKYSLGLCHMLGITYRFDVAWITGALTLLILLLVQVTFKILRKLFPLSLLWQLRFILLAFWVTFIEILGRAYIPNLTAILGIYFPLLAVNTFILFVLFPTTVSPEEKATISLLYGAVYLVSLGLMGFAREILGMGTLTVIQLPQYTLQLRVFKAPLKPLKIILLPAGGLILLGYFQALIGWIGFKVEHRRIE